MGDRSRLCTKPARVHYLAAATYLCVCCVHVCTHLRVWKCLCFQDGWYIRTPLRKYMLLLVPLQCPFSLLSIWRCVCLPLCVCVLPSSGGIHCNELLMKRKVLVLSFYSRQREGRRDKETGAHTQTHVHINA